MRKHSGASGGAFYGLGMIGVFVYFMQHAHTFTDVLIGIVKSLVWPAFLSFRLFEFLKM
jgi:hypothetical protein